MKIIGEDSDGAPDRFGIDTGVGSATALRKALVCLAVHVKGV